MFEMAHRRDIQGLRAIAVVLVVLHHAFPSALPGGFIGVDVFFVISGYLITLQLMQMQGQPFLQVLSNFYARRAKRILPMALLVAVVIVLVAFVVLGPIEGRQAARDGLWATLFLANVDQLRQAVDYFGAGEASLFRHYWSLAVEEQFYLVWPVLFGFVAIVAKARSRMVLAVLVCGVTAASAGYFLFIFKENPTFAYFNTFARVWEIGAGAAAALVVRNLVHSEVLRVGSVLAIAGFSLGLTSATMSPGLLLVPVATLAILNSSSAGPTHRFLSSAVMHYIGSLSFSLYLWHWPALQLLKRLKDNPSGIDIVSALLCAFAVTVLTHHFWENPLRFNVKLPNRLILGVGSTALVLSSLIVSLAAREPNEVPVAQPTTVALPSALATAPRISQSPSESPSPSATKGAQSSQSESVQSAPQTLDEWIEDAIGLVEFPKVLKPPLVKAAADKSPWLTNGCSVDFADSAMVECVAGSPSGPKTMVVYGDSHASMWMTALDAIAKDAGYKIYLFAKLACPLPRELVWSYQLNRPFEECTKWQSEVIARIDQLNPEVIVVTDQFKPAVVNGKKSDAETAEFWRRNFPKALNELQSLAPKVIVIGNNPSMTTDSIKCASMPGATPSDCISSRNSAGNGAINSIEQSAAESLGMTYVDTVAFACNSYACPAVINGMVVYFDQWHFTDTYVKWLRPELERAIGEL